MIVTPKTTNNVSKKILKAGAICATAIIPATYMTKLHMDMFKKDDKQNRAIMKNKMFGFFTGIGLSIILIHKRAKAGIFTQSGIIALAAITPFLGLGAAKEINKKLYPDKNTKIAKVI